MIPAPPVAVTGATGFVGQAVLDEAEKRGASVKALTRREQASRGGIEWVRGDLADEAALTELVRDSGAVLHIAGVIKAADEAGFVDGNVRGTERVVAAARDAGVRRFVLVSSLAAREPGLSLYGKSKRLAEEVVQTSGLAWTIVRPPTVYGPRDRETLELFRMAKRGIVPMPGEGRSSIVHAEDLARLLLDLAAGSLAAERILEPHDGRESGWTHEDLARAIGDAVGRQVRVPRVPAGLLRFAAKMDEALRRSNAKLTQDRVGYMTHPDWTSDRSRAVPDDVWTAQIATPVGLRTTAEWYREAGWL